LLSQTVSLANASYQGAFLFAGTKVSTQPFTLDTTTNTVTYNGNSATTSVQLSDGNSINANLPGDQLFQNGSGSVTGALQDLYSALTTGTNIPASVTEVQNALNQVNQQRVFYGNNLNQISLSESFLNQDKLNLSQQEKRPGGSGPGDRGYEFRAGAGGESGDVECDGAGAGIANVVGLPEVNFNSKFSEP